MLTPDILTQLSKSETAHKYDHGHVLVLTGGVGRGGAARLAARGALRIGAGLVTLGCPPAALIENAAQLNAIMLKRVDDAEALDDILTDTRINALCIGPGLGTGEDARGLVEAGLKSRRAMVLDADALTLMAAHPGLRKSVHDRCVLTPHAGEFARLFPSHAKRLTDDPTFLKAAATSAAAKELGCTLLLKGSDTVIADQQGRSFAENSGSRPAPWLATAGSGDVLAGFIAGLLARGFDPIEAASTAHNLHRDCARAFGPGLIAEDLTELLPSVLKTLGVD